jgi:integrase/recombinase XerD
MTSKNEASIVLQPQNIPIRFDISQVSAFIYKSVSLETRRSYQRVVKEFFGFVGNVHPSQVESADVLSFRDSLMHKGRRPATVAFKLSVIRSLFDYLKANGIVLRNPAETKLVPPPALAEDLRGRALTRKEVRYLLSGPDTKKAEGARDYAIMLLLLRTSMRVAEACSLRKSSMQWINGRWALKFKVKGGRERTIPLPAEVKSAIEASLRLDKDRRQIARSGGKAADEWLFQPLQNYRTLVYDKPLSTTMVWYIVSKWGKFTGVGKLSPHDLRRTAITTALDKGLNYRQVQMMSGHKDPKTVMRYDHGRENLEQNAINFFDYE